MANSDPYDPVSYWNSRPNPNRRGATELQEGDRIWDYVSRHIGRGQQLFEYGPGIGRLFGLYAGHRLSTLDISRRYASAVDTAAAKHGLTVEQHFSDDPCAPFPFSDDQFDVALAVQVLIHVPFEQIRHALAELGRVARKTVIVSSHVPSWPAADCEAKPTDYCFNHEYFVSLGEMGFSVSDVQIWPDAKYFAYQ